MIALRKNVILRSARRARLEGRTALITAAVIISAIPRGWPLAPVPPAALHWRRHNGPARHRSDGRACPPRGEKARARRRDRRPCPPSGDENRGGAPGQQP